GIDLSVGSTLSLCGISFGILSVNFGIDPWLASLITLLVGGILGLINAFIVAVIGVPPLIATLATLYLYSSLALVLSNGVDINGFNRSGFSFLGQGRIFGIPTQVILVMLPAFLIVSWMMNQTRLGREIYQVGSSEKAAALAGVQVNR